MALASDEVSSEATFSSKAQAYLRRCKKNNAAEKREKVED
jgi:hypothetical protein